MAILTPLLIGAAAGATGMWAYLRRQQGTQSAAGPAPVKAQETAAAPAQEAADDSSSSAK